MSWDVSGQTKSIKNRLKQASRDLLVFAVGTLWKRPSRGCTSFASWRSSIYHRCCWRYSHWVCPLHFHSLLWLSYKIRRLQRTVRTPESAPVHPSPLSMNCSQRKWPGCVRSRGILPALLFTLDPTHPGHLLFELMPSGPEH